MSELSSWLPAFAPILNSFVLTAAEPVEIIPGYAVERASMEIVERFRHLIAMHSSYRGFNSIPNYECHRVEQSTPNGVGYRFEASPKSEWRYNVVAARTSTDALSDIELASTVAEIELVIPTTFLKEGSVGYGARASHFFANSPISADSHPIVDATMVGDISAAYAEMLSVREEYPEVGRAIKILSEMRLLPMNSDFEVLGLFAIIEMLITHNPVLKDVGDSITHQMKGKIPLLSKRFSKPLDYSSFGDVPEDTVWAKLYSYRSCLAHGGVADFGRGELSLLKSHGFALAFLRKAVRALIRHGFREPQLLRNLKAC